MFEKAVRKIIKLKPSIQITPILKKKITDSFKLIIKDKLIICCIHLKRSVPYIILFVVKI